MSIKAKVKSLLMINNISAKELAPALGTAEQTANNRISTGITSIKDLIKIVNYCGGSLTIKAKDGTIIPLTIEDIEEKK